MIVRRDTSSRRERIVALLREQNSVQIPELAELFAVSTQTVRKDLNFLDSKGVCTRSPGGALLRLGALSRTEEAIDVRRRRHAEEKARTHGLPIGVESDGDDPRQRVHGLERPD